METKFSGISATFVCETNEVLYLSFVLHYLLVLRLTITINLYKKNYVSDLLLILSSKFSFILTLILSYVFIFFTFVLLQR